MSGLAGSTARRHRPASIAAAIPLAAVLAAAFAVAAILSVPATALAQVTVPGSSEIRLVDRFPWKTNGIHGVRLQSIARSGDSTDLRSGDAADLRPLGSDSFGPPDPGMAGPTIRLSDRAAETIEARPSPAAAAVLRVRIDPLGESIRVTGRAAISGAGGARTRFSIHPPAGAGSSPAWEAIDRGAFDLTIPCRPGDEILFAVEAAGDGPPAAGTWRRVRFHGVIPPIHRLARAGLHVHSVFSYQGGEGDIDAWLRGRSDFPAFLLSWLGGLDHAFAGSPAEIAADPSGLDLIGFSDHAEALAPEEWTELGRVAAETPAAGRPAVLRGFEWTGDATDAGNHLNVYGSDRPIGALPSPTPRKGNGSAASPPEAYLSRTSWAEMMDWIGGCQCVAGFNHVANPFYLARDPDNPRDFELHPAAARNLKLLEVSGGSRAVAEARYRRALARGWHVGPTIGVDNQFRLGSDGWDIGIGRPIRQDARTEHTGLWIPDAGSIGEEIPAAPRMLESLARGRVFASWRRDLFVALSAKAPGDDAPVWMGDAIEVARDGSLILEARIGGSDSDRSLNVELVDLDGVARWIGTVGNAAIIVPLGRDVLRRLPMNNTGDRPIYARITQPGSGAMALSAPLRIRGAGTPVKAGDIDGNGKLTAGDARMALWIAAGRRRMTEGRRVAGDLNGDGTIDRKDAAAILRLLSQ